MMRGSPLWAFLSARIAVQIAGLLDCQALRRIVRNRGPIIVDDLAYQSAAQIAAAIRNKKVLPREILDVFIERLRPWQHIYEKCRARPV
jgi:hypothetical protein